MDLGRAGQPWIPARTPSAPRNRRLVRDQAGSRSGPPGRRTGCERASGRRTAWAPARRVPRSMRYNPAHSPMDADRWRRIEALYHGALTLSVPDRADYLDKACGADATLRHEVESLIRHNIDSDALNTIDGRQSAQRVVEADALPPGQTWGDFRLI